MTMLDPTADFMRAMLHTLVKPKALKSVTIELADHDAIMDLRRQLGRDFQDIASVPVTHDRGCGIVIMGIPLNLVVQDDNH